MFDSKLQSLALDKADCNQVQSSFDVIALYNFASSAYKPDDVAWGMTSGRSLINKRKSMGPRMLPCGTPEVIGDHPEATPITTRCVRPRR